MDNRPFCANGCKSRYICRKNGVVIRYGNEDQPASTGDSVLHGDLWECPACDSRIIIGWAQVPNDPNIHPERQPFILAAAHLIDDSAKGYTTEDEAYERVAS